MCLHKYTGFVIPANLLKRHLYLVFHFIVIQFALQILSIQQNPRRCNGRIGSEPYNFKVVFSRHFKTRFGWHGFCGRPKDPPSSCNFPPLARHRWSPALQTCSFRGLWSSPHHWLTRAFDIEAAFSISSPFKDNEVAQNPCCFSFHYYRLALFFGM